jgi:dipeptidase
MELITCLLEKYGQGGNCGFSHPFHYNNSFLITDRQESWVLETIGKDWAARNLRRQQPFERFNLERKLG